MQSSFNHKLDNHIRDCQKGAFDLTIEAIDLLSEYALTHLDTSNYRSNITMTCEKITAAHPCMANLHNVINWWQLFLLSTPLNNHKIIKTQEIFKKHLKKANKDAVERALPILLNANSIISCSNSSTIALALSRAVELGYNSPIWLYYQTKQQKHLSELMRYSLDHTPKQIELTHQKIASIDEQSLILIGADTVSPQGIINGQPSLNLIDLYPSTPSCVIAETVKYSLIYKPVDGFDCIDLTKFRSIISELCIHTKISKKTIHQYHNDWINLLI